MLVIAQAQYVQFTQVAVVRRSLRRLQLLLCCSDAAMLSLIQRGDFANPFSENSLLFGPLESANPKCFRTIFQYTNRRSFLSGGCKHRHYSFLTLAHHSGMTKLVQYPDS